MQTKTCLECGKEFQTKSGTQKYCKGPHTSICEVCGSTFEYTCSPKEKPRTCSRKCQTGLQRITARKKYGVDNVSQIKEVRKKISDNHKTDEFKNKVKATCQKRYGVDNVAQSEIAKQHQRETFLKNYGVDNPMKDDGVKNKLRDSWKYGNARQKYLNTIIKNHGVHHPVLIPEVRERIIQSNINKFGVPFYVLSKDYREPKISNVISKLNQNFGNDLIDCGLDIEYEFVIENRSFDIHIINTNILIELNPTYTHSTQPNHWNTETGLDKYYHRDKTKLAEKHGYRCINIWDWDDCGKILNILSPKSKLYARKLKLGIIDNSKANEFLGLYHLQGAVSNQIICLGLIHDNELVQLMTFGVPRYNKNYEWELLRLCTHKDYKVVGGAERLFKHFIKTYSPKSIISYCDKSKFSGDVYERLGFESIRINSPTKHWSKDDKHILDSLLLTRGYDQLFGTNYGKGTSNEQLMLNDGWRSVYDCGQQVWSYQSDLQ